MLETRTIAILALIIACTAGAYSLLKTNSSSVPHKESAYERVIRTRTLRCGYFLWPPFMMQDPNSKKLSGMNYEYAEAIGKSLDLSVTWTEIPPGQQVESLRNEKIDAVCGSEAPLVMAASAYLTYVEPIMFEHFEFYVRANDLRFDNNIQKANAPDIVMATMDGDITQEAAAKDFPHAKLDQLPNSADPAQLMLDVVNRKADIVINDTFSAANFLKANPGTLRKVSMDKPAAVIPNQFSVLRGEETLANMLGQAVLNLRYRKIEDKILGHMGTEYQDGIYKISLP